MHRSAAVVGGTLMEISFPYTCRVIVRSERSISLSVEGGTEYLSLRPDVIHASAYTEHKHDAPEYIKVHSLSGVTVPIQGASE